MAKKKTIKVTEIKSNVKKISEEHKDSSKLESEIEESNGQNFTRFIKSSSGNIVPVLESEQPEQSSAQAQTSIRRTPVTTADTRSPYVQSSNQLYFSSSSPATQAERARSYKPITEPDSAPVIKSAEIIRSQPQTQFQDSLDARRGGISEGDSDKKYKSAIERGRDKGKPRYEWE